MDKAQGGGGKRFKAWPKYLKSDMGILILDISHSKNFELSFDEENIMWKMKVPNLETTTATEICRDYNDISLLMMQLDTTYYLTLHLKLPKLIPRRKIIEDLLNEILKEKKYFKNLLIEDETENGISGVILPEKLEMKTLEIHCESYSDILLKKLDNEILQDLVVDCRNPDKISSWSSVADLICSFVNLKSLSIRFSNFTTSDFINILDKCGKLIEIDSGFGHFQIDDELARKIIRKCEIYQRVRFYAPNVVNNSSLLDNRTKCPKNLEFCDCGDDETEAVLLRHYVPPALRTAKAA